MDSIDQKAAEFAGRVHVNQRRKFTNDPYVVHLAGVAMLTRNFVRDPEVVAAAWLHDAIEDSIASPNPTNFDELVREFGIYVAAMVRTLSDMQVPGDGNREHRKKVYFESIARASAEVQIIKVADLLDNLSSLVVYDYAFARVFLKEARMALELFTKIPGRLRVLATNSFNSAELFLREVVGIARNDIPRLSSGHPATYGAYRMLAKMSFGPEAPCVKWLEEKISWSAEGPGEEVPIPEEEMLAFLQDLNARNLEVPQ